MQEKRRADGTSFEAYVFCPLIGRDRSIRHWIVRAEAYGGFFMQGQVGSRYTCEWRVDLDLEHSKRMGLCFRNWGSVFANVFEFKESKSSLSELKKSRSCDAGFGEQERR
jgi:hypothetical protein